MIVNCDNDEIPNYRLIITSRVGAIDVAEDVVVCPELLTLHDNNNRTVLLVLDPAIGNSLPIFNDILQRRRMQRRRSTIPAEINEWRDL